MTRRRCASATSGRRAPSARRRCSARRAGDGVEPVPLPTIHDAVMAVHERRRSTRALVPIENSLEGSVNATLDALAGEARDVAIVGEARARRPPLPDRARAALELERDRDAWSRTRRRPAQCARFLRERLPRAVVAAASTAEAVRAVAERATTPWAALGTRLAAELYGGAVLREGVEDRADNETRFVWLARADAGTVRRRDGAGRAKTSLVFWGAGDAVAGLARALPVGVRRPRHQPHEDRVAPAARAARPLHVLRRPRGRATTTRRSPTRWTALRAHCEEVRVLGSYPARAARPRCLKPADGVRGTLPHMRSSWTARPTSSGRVRAAASTGHGPTRRVSGGRVLVLNATYEPINVCTVRRAVVLLLKEKAELSSARTWELHSETPTLPRPVVIRLVTYVRVPRDTHRRKITRRAVFARDGWTCQYCGARSNLTVDHVIPRSKGGAVELGEHRRLAARRATGARATGCRARPACTRASSRARRARRSSSTSPARRSRRRGGSTCPRRPDGARRARDRVPRRLRLRRRARRAAAGPGARRPPRRRHPRRRTRRRPRPRPFVPERRLPRGRTAVARAAAARRRAPDRGPRPPDVGQRLQARAEPRVAALGHRRPG